MCMLLNSLPKRSKSAGTAKRKSIVLSLKPCQDVNGKKSWYRVRLLNFKSKTTDRDYPFIERFVHQHWKVNDKGFPEIEDEVTCPVTRWMNWDGDRYDTCPICRYANQQFITLKESGWKDANARKKNKEFGRKYQAIIPVYVVDDPNYEGNNGKFKVIIFGDKKVYDSFLKKVETQLMTANCFNGKNAVDCCIHMAEVPEVRNEGQPNEYVYKNKVIDKITFSNKPTDIDAITPETIDAQLPFDETYYVSSTKEEIQAFHDKYIKVSNDDIVDDEDDVKVYEAPQVENVVKTNSIKTTVVENTEIKADDIESLTNDLVEDVAADETNTETKQTQDTSDADVDDLLKELDI